MWSCEDIIIAVASPPGPSPRGLIRLSGGGAFDVAGQSIATDDTPPQQRCAALTRLQLGRRSLPALCFMYPRPRSYTGEDVVELMVPGNTTLLNQIIESLIRRFPNVRRAEAGEFTARAFLNGRLSLTQAEGIAALISAQSDDACHAARQMTRNRFGQTIENLADRLGSLLGLVEAGIDFTDQEDVVAIDRETLLTRLLSISNDIDGLVQHSVGFEKLNALPMVVLAGRPNAGKSTLFNALLKQNRSVVSDRPGTTRDVLVEHVAHTFRGHSTEFNLVDIPGLEESHEGLNPLMQNSAREMLSRADLVLFCSDSDDASVSRSTNVLRVRTKIDLRSSTGQDDVVRTSAARGVGLDQLRDAIAERLAQRERFAASEQFAILPRHAESLGKAGAELSAAIDILHSGGTGIELVAASIRIALDRLGEIVGAVTPDDVLGRIFSTFCVGK